MNISKQYAWRSAVNYRGNNSLLPQNLRGLVIGKSGCGKTAVIFNLLLQPGRLDYNHLYVFGKSLHQQEYKVLRKGLEAGLSKQKFPIYSTVKKRWKYIAPHIMERYELTFTMIVRVFQIH